MQKLEALRSERNPKSVLIIEDNQDHIELIKRAIKLHPLDVKIYHATDGEDALDFLFKKGKYLSKRNIPVPDLILLDIKLPKIDGYNVLKKIKSHQEFKAIPVIVLTTSAREEDINRMYKHGACSYLVKPSQYLEFVAIHEKIKDVLKTG